VKAPAAAFPQNIPVREDGHVAERHAPYCRYKAGNGRVLSLYADRPERYSLEVAYKGRASPWHVVRAGVFSSEYGRSFPKVRARSHLSSHRVFPWRTERTPVSAGKFVFLHDYRRISTFLAGISQTAR